MDKFDYIERDAQNLGLRSSYDAKRLLMYSRIVNNEICYHHKEVVSNMCSIILENTLFLIYYLNNLFIYKIFSIIYTRCFIQGIVFSNVFIHIVLVRLFQYQSLSLLSSCIDAYVINLVLVMPIAEAIEMMITDAMIEAGKA